MTMRDRYCTLVQPALTLPNASSEPERDHVHYLQVSLIVMTPLRIANQLYIMGYKRDDDAIRICLPPKKAANRILTMSLASIDLNIIRPTAYKGVMLRAESSGEVVKVIVLENEIWM
jgi:hypothetical protein